MEEIITEQSNNLRLITNMGNNFKKSPKSRLTEGYIQTRIEILTEYWNQFKETHYKITKVATGKERYENIYFTEDWFLQGQEEYIELKSDMQDLLKSLSQSPNIHSSSQERKVEQEVKLPQINIPQFNGNYHDWCTFRDLYTSLIHQNTSLSKIQKLYYLKSSITGEAEQLLRHIQITENNYEIAWNTLNKRYNNRRMIVNSILQRLIGQRKMNTGTARGIKEMLNITVECLNSLKNNDVDVSNWDVLITYLMVGKLDEESHKSWEEELGNLSIEILPSLEKFINFLETRFRVLEMIQPIQVRDRIENNPKSFLTNISNIRNNVTCLMCKENHFLTSCNKYINLNVEERVQFVQNQLLCFNCLSPYHRARYCKSKKSCQHCRRRHHSSLHFITKFERNIKYSPHEKINCEKEKDEGERVLRTHFVTQDQNALMATALLNIETGKGLHMVRALIDPCSQESFISERAAQNLQLSQMPVNGNITGINQMSTKIKHVAELQLRSRVNKNFKKLCTAYVVKRVIDNLPSQALSSKSCKHLQDLRLADPTYNEPGYIDMLLGVNVYTEILESGVIKGEPGEPIGQQTQLGWIISGGAGKDTRNRGYRDKD
jgi:hypothetical protein